MPTCQPNLGLIAYLRVSTPRQGTTGTSLSEQRRAIDTYASAHGLFIQSWRTEVATAAKRGRSAFSEVVTELSTGRAKGLIVHKVDRSARNLRDWADLSDLIDRGVEVHFVHDGLDLESRGGRLSADIQAVFAADYIRNLRDETQRGMRARFQAGLYPLPSPLGYLDQGPGQMKTLDPERAPMIRQLFETYATGQHSLETLVREASRQGFRNRQGRPLQADTLSRIFRNRFYIGTTNLRHTGKMFQGAHEPLVSPELFAEVQVVLGRRYARRHRTALAFRFSRQLRCRRCHRSLVGERQKGHVYYRCHGRGCGICFREDRIAPALRAEVESSIPTNGVTPQGIGMYFVVDKKKGSIEPSFSLSTGMVA